jgi:hypothetical protein
MRTWVMAALCLALSSQAVWAAKKTKSPRKPRTSQAMPVQAPPPVRHAFRCGNLYQALPCTENASRRISIADSRSQAQIAQAQQTQARDDQQVKAIDKAQAQALRQAQKKRQVAIALSCPGWPKQPFDGCNTNNKNRDHENARGDKKMSKRIKARSAADNMSGTTPLPVRP